MKTKYPVRKLIGINIWLTQYFFIFGLVINLLFNGNEGFRKILISSVIGALLLIMNAFANVLLLLFFERRLFINKFVTIVRFLGLSYLVSIISYITVTGIILNMTNSELPLQSHIYLVIILILINTLIMLVQNWVVVNDQKAKSDIENSMLKAAHADAVNQLLRQQIHPHFLFNALNVLKSLYKVDAVAGESYLIHLSDFLRAAITNFNTRISTIAEELKICDDYLEMQKIRFGNALTYSVSVSDDIKEMGFVPSFSVQPLLENVIKHNELTEEDPLHISIKQEDDRIVVSNNRKIKVTAESSVGSGLSNLSERYRILAGEEIIINEDEHYFSVSIGIIYPENSAATGDFHNTKFMTGNR